MAMQIMIGIKKGTEVFFDEKQKLVNYTDTIKEICNNYFEEMNFTEDGEEITYSVIESNIFDKVMQLICEKQESIINEIRNVRGNEERNDIVNRLNDYILIMSIFVNAISLSKQNRDVVIVLV